MTARHLTPFLAAIALAAAPTGALAQTGAEGYPQVRDSSVSSPLPLSGGGSGGGGGAGGGDGGSLPFTGLDLGFVALGGAALMAAGFALRQIRREPEA